MSTQHIIASSKLEREWRLALPVTPTCRRYTRIMSSPIIHWSGFQLFRGWHTKHAIIGNPQVVIMKCHWWMQHHFNCDRLSLSGSMIVQKLLSSLDPSTCCMIQPQSCQELVTHNWILHPGPWFSHALSLPLHLPQPAGAKTWDEILVGCPAW